MNACERKCSLCPQGKNKKQLTKWCVDMSSLHGHCSQQWNSTLYTEFPSQSVSHFESDPWNKEYFETKNCDFKEEERTTWNTIEGNLHCSLSFWCDSEWMNHEDLFPWYLHRPAPRCTAIWPTELHQPLYMFATWVIFHGPLTTRMCLPLLMSHFLPLSVSPDTILYCLAV